MLEYTTTCDTSTVVMGGRSQEIFCHFSTSERGQILSSNGCWSFGLRVIQSYPDKLVKPIQLVQLGRSSCCMSLDFYSDKWTPEGRKEFRRIYVFLINSYCVTSLKLEFVGCCNFRIDMLKYKWSAFIDGMQCHYLCSTNIFCFITCS